jgi:hypothetical protein
MNGIVLGCLMAMCLVGTITAQTGSGSSAANTNYLASRMLASGGGAGGMAGMGGMGGMGGLGRLFPLLAFSGAGNDALMPMMMCRNGMNFMCMMALSQGGIM